MCTVKAKFHYAIQVAHLVADPIADLAFDKFVRVCDQLAVHVENNYSSAIAERPSGARVTSIRKIAKWNF